MCVRRFRRVTLRVHSNVTVSLVNSVNLTGISSRAHGQLKSVPTKCPTRRCGCLRSERVRKVAIIWRMSQRVARIYTVWACDPYERYLYSWISIDELRKSVFTFWRLLVHDPLCVAGSVGWLEDRNREKERIINYQISWLNNDVFCSRFRGAQPRCEIQRAGSRSALSQTLGQSLINLECGNLFKRPTFSSRTESWMLESGSVPLTCRFLKVEFQFRNSDLERVWSVHILLHWL